LYIEVQSSAADANPARDAGLLADLGLPATVLEVAAEPTVELARAGEASSYQVRAEPALRRWT
jgi:hypothetical protein